MKGKRKNDLVEHWNAFWVRERSVGKETLMHKRVLKSMALTAFAVLVAIPAFAQVRADVGPLHIRIATDAPPPVRHEVRAARPDHTAVWTNGYWDRQGDQWAWSSGRWQQPVAPRARWVKASYKREGSAWRYDPAHWSNQQLVEGDDYQAYRKAHNSDRDRH